VKKKAGLKKSFENANMAAEQKRVEWAAVSTEPTNHWCRKMRTHFEASIGKKGYITKEEVMEKARATLKLYPELNADMILDGARNSWVQDLNCGMEPPSGYRLTEAQFVQNMWLVVNQPSYKQRVKEITAKVFENLDKDKKGYVTRANYLRMAKLVNSEETVTKIYDALDASKSGKVDRAAMERMYTFFFTDTEDEQHPFNFLRGPLVD
jgi:Ca2+-binding EF-hand superfamily protein